MLLVDPNYIQNALDVFRDTEHGNAHFLYGIATAKEIVTYAPTIDAEPVVHGEWIVHNPDNPFAIYGECPVCHEEVGRKWNYCPNCGAKMDGGAHASNQR